MLEPKPVTWACIIPLGPDEPLPLDLISTLTDHAVPITLSATRPPPDCLDAGITWLYGEPGRGHQLNQAIQATPAQWHWLVHADSAFESSAIRVIGDFCAHATWQTLGYGDLRFNDDGPALVRLNQWGANLRSQWLNLPYGDQGLCIHKALWTALGGFSEALDRGEDLDLVIRARRVGAHPRRLPFNITTSARRYRSQGWLNTTIRHQIKAWQLIRAAKRWRP